MNVLFDTLDYARGAERVGIIREHAEYQADQLAKIVEKQSERTVTKNVMNHQLKTLEISIIKWVIGISIVQMGTILTIIGFMFKK